MNRNPNLSFLVMLTASSNACLVQTSVEVPLSDTGSVDEASTSWSAESAAWWADAPDEKMVELDDPCTGGGTPYAMLFTDVQTGWIGCGNGMGLWRTDDGGSSFSRGHPSNDLYVFDLTEELNGKVLSCGRDYGEAGDGVLLSRFDGDNWDPILSYGHPEEAPDQVYMSSCGAVAAAGDGTILVAGNTTGDITWTKDEGQTWGEVLRYWEDADLEGDGTAEYSMLNLEAAAGHYFGAGSKITQPPTFFGPSRDEQGNFYNFSAIVMDDGAVGEVRALGTPDAGKRWLAGGRDQNARARASGFLYRSEDGGGSWTRVDLPDEIDILHDIAFSNDGTYGIAVGHRYPISNGGFVLESTDGGVSWTALNTDLAPLQSAAVAEGNWWVAGDGYLARGRF